MRQTIRNVKNAAVKQDSLQNYTENKELRFSPLGGCNKYISMLSDPSRAHPA